MATSISATSLASLPTRAVAQAAAPSPTESDSFDEDLGWILEKLSVRADATFGAILRYIEGEAEAAPLALYAQNEPLTPAALRCLHDALRPWQGTCPQARLDDAVHSLSLDLRPHGSPAVRILFLHFTPAAGVVIVAAICRPESSFMMLQEVVAGRLQPVLQRYVRLWWLHRTERRRANVFQRTIDQSDLGIALLDRRARLLFANQASVRILDAQDGLRRVGAGMATADAGDLVRFQRAVQQAINENRAPGSAGKPCSTLVTVSRGAKRALMVSIAAVDRVAIDPEDAAAVLYILDPEQDVTALLAPAYRIYRLTGAEARLVSFLVSGADLAAAAASMNLAMHTARSYLKQVFAKTATNRQAELVRVMCGSAARAAIATNFSLL